MSATFVTECPPQDRISKYTCVCIQVTSNFHYSHLWKHRGGRADDAPDCNKFSFVHPGHIFEWMFMKVPWELGLSFLRAKKFRWTDSVKTGDFSATSFFVFWALSRFGIFSPILTEINSNQIKTADRWRHAVNFVVFSVKIFGKKEFPNRLQISLIFFKNIS